VFLPGLTDGTMPIIYAQTAEAIEEERRLLYVGVTRARERVHLSWTLARSPGGRRSRTPSRFLQDLSTPGRQDRAGRARPAGGAPAGSASGGSDDPVLARLRDWRKARAKEQGVPAYVIFSDATLQWIAERQPATTGELAAVPGVGPVKLNRYGAAVLALCTDISARADG
jgi:DNA helicase-2/ATP-dependent DNA helicase PcrA